MSNNIPVLLDDFRYAFIDETGSFGFDFSKQGTSSHFIITAIIILPEDKSEVEIGLQKIKQRFFQDSEMKFLNLNPDRDRKIFQIITSVNKLPFYIISFVADKKKIFKTSGLRFKKSFIKYLNKRLYNELKTLYNSLDIIADSQGTKEFVKEFKNYFYSTPSYTDSLFENYQIDLVDSKTNIFVQLADIMTGIVSTGYEKDKITKNYPIFKNLLRDRIIKIDEWPIDYENFISKVDLLNSKEFDKRIAEISLKLCIKFIIENEKSKETDKIEQLLVVKYLMSNLQYRSNDYISSKELKIHLQKILSKEFKSRYFMSIIAKLRDNGVLIASSSQGYKIPVSTKDIYSYTNHSLSVVSPMLERLFKCRTRVLAITENKLDILNTEDFAKLRNRFV